MPQRQVQSADCCFDASSVEQSILMVWTVWQNWALSGIPAQWLAQGFETGQLAAHPELIALPGVPQDPQWHPEGDVWVHTLHVCDAAAAIAEREQLDVTERTVLLLSALCHDLGKAPTTAFVDGRWRAHDHCAAGVPLTRSFLERIGCPVELIETVEPLVAEHLVHVQPLKTARAKARLVRRLGRATVTQLVRLIEADLKGRPPLPGELTPAVLRLRELPESLPPEPEPIRPLIQGRHLIALGHHPAVWFGDVLRACESAQRDEVFDTEDSGIAYLRRLLAETKTPEASR